MSPRYTLVARVASASDPGRSYDVKTDGERLTCSCPGWTRRTQEDGSRTCRHVREVAPRVAEIGNLSFVARLLRRGMLPTGLVSEPVDNTAAPVVALPPAPTATCTLACVAAFATGPSGTVRCGHGRLVLEALRDALTRVGGRPLPDTLAVRTPDWLGGGRAIILRD